VGAHARTAACVLTERIREVVAELSGTADVWARRTQVGGRPGEDPRTDARLGVARQPVVADAPVEGSAWGETRTPDLALMRGAL
jgi:hypothetical protein